MDKIYSVSCEHSSEGSLVIVEFLSACGVIPTISYLAVEANKSAKGTLECRTSIKTDSFCVYPLPPESYAIKGKDAAVWKKL